MISIRRYGAGHLCLYYLLSDTGLWKIEEIIRPGKLVNVEAANSVLADGVHTGINQKVR